MRLTSPCDRAKPLQPDHENIEPRGMHTSLKPGAPINDIPIELLSEIFLYAKASGRPPIYNARWHHILRVCRHWFVVATGTPRLWSRILVRKGLSNLRNSLVRSQGVPLDICLLPYGIPRDSSLTFVVPIITPHIHRLQRIQLDIIPENQVTEALAFLQAHSFPILSALTACATRTDPKQPLQLEPDRFPSLRELRVAHLNVFSAAVTPQLTTLNVATYDGRGTSFDLDALLDVFVTLKNIENLTLSRIAVSNTTTPRPPRYPRVELVQLRSLTLVLHAPVLKRLLDDFIIPPSAKVTLQSFDSGVIDSYLPDDKSSLPILSKVTVARMHALAHEHFFEGSLASSEDNLMLADSYVHLSYTPQVEVLHVKTSPSSSLEVSWWIALSYIPRLQELSISVAMVDGELASPLDRIFTPFDATPHPMTWEAAQACPNPIMCPELRRLRLVGNWRWTDNVPDRIMSFLNKRREILEEEVVLEELSIDMYHEGWHGYFEERKKMLEDAMSPFVARAVVVADWSPEALE
ncbi:hypothetical protein ONZ51_g5746 [Trametes cubensis]|uniref:F-box domain-containing protein n=1 Tax=Trametes cubensis TaxID=1111947 RepID=A0AAD7XAN4_9APHY|nr:hypothetical protein ONZ51_g5746 [Trametes cubensis]